MNNAPDLDSSCFSAMVRLDQNRAISQVASKTARAVTDIKKVTIWGNHSATQYPDLFNAQIDGKSVASLINDQAWIENDFIPTVQQRGKAIIDARGLSSAASAAMPGRFRSGWRAARSRSSSPRRTSCARRRSSSGDSRSRP